MAASSSTLSTGPVGASPRPWYREFYVWMVIAGPLSAVIACAITAFYILQGPDALVSEDYYREGIEMARQVKTATPPMQPAQTGRNHSATGGKTDVNGR
ncbi:MAG: FixH family protein [Pseudomonadota bacterium]